MTWRNEMMQEIKMSHLANAAAAKGGWDQMSQADYGRAGQAIRAQYDYLNKFAQQVADGEQKLDGTLTRRAQMYAEAGRDTYEATVKAERKKRGLMQVRSVLHPGRPLPGVFRRDGKGLCGHRSKTTNGPSADWAKGLQNFG